MNQYEIVCYVFTFCVKEMTKLDKNTSMITKEIAKIINIQNL